MSTQLFGSKLSLNFLFFCRSLWQNCNIPSKLFNIFYTASHLIFLIILAQNWVHVTLELQPCSLVKALQNKSFMAPQLIGVWSPFGPQIWSWKDLGHLCIWSHYHSVSRGVCHTKVDHPNCLFDRLDTLTLTKESDGAKWGSWAVHFRRIFFKQKLLCTTKLSGAGSPNPSGALVTLIQ